jgi:hypothetical protein
MMSPSFSLVAPGQIRSRSRRAARVARLDEADRFPVPLLTQQGQDLLEQQSADTAALQGVVDPRLLLTFRPGWAALGAGALGAHG